MNIQLNKNKVSLNQCKKMVKAINTNESLNNIPLKFSIHKNLIQDTNNIKYSLLIFNLNTNDKKQEIYNLNELHNHLLKAFIKI